VKNQRRFHRIKFGVKVHNLDFIWYIAEQIANQPCPVRGIGENLT